METRNNVNRNQIGSLPAPEIRNPFKVCGENSELLINDSKNHDNKPKKKYGIINVRNLRKKKSVNPYFWDL